MQLYTNTFWKQLTARPDNDIICQTEHHIYTAKQIIEKSLDLAKNLHQCQFHKGDKVVLALEPSIDFIIILYACMLLGAQIAIIDPHMGKIHYQAMLRQFNPSWAFVDGRLILLQEHPILRYLYLKFKPNGIYLPVNKQINTVACGINFPLFTPKYTLKSLYKSNYEGIHWEEIKSEDPFLVVYTSGTTSVPKAVVHSYKNISASLSAVEKILNLQRADNIATHLPHFVLLAVQSGMIAHIWKENWSPARKLQYIKNNNIQSLFQPPSELLPLIEWSLKKGLKLPNNLKHIMLGSAPVYPSFLRVLYELGPESLKVTCIYGMTEHLIVSYTDGRTKLSVDPSLGDFVGNPIENVTIDLNNKGNLLVSSPQLFLRYFHQSSRNESHDTGDIVTLVDNNIYLQGRDKNMIIRRNTNIYPELYEPTLASITGVKDVAMFGKYSPEEEDEIIYLLIEPIGEHYSKKEILKSIRQKLTFIHRDAAPEKIIFGKVPRKGRQLKVDRQALLKLVS